MIGCEGDISISRQCTASSSSSPVRGPPPAPHMPAPHGAAVIGPWRAASAAALRRCQEDGRRGSQLQGCLYSRT
jgi:hypothetical protein